MARRKGLPRNGMKAIPRQIIEKDESGIEIRRYSIRIFGSHEVAAKAMAEDILKRKPTNLTLRDLDALPAINDHQTIRYMDVIEVSCQQNHYTINLMGSGVGLISPEVWATFKKNVEKMCNNLKAFL